MKKNGDLRRDHGVEGPTLTISPEMVCFISIKARELNAKDVDSELESGSNPSDDDMIGVLEDNPSDDAVWEELSGAISALSEDEQIDLVALAWLGRDDHTIEDWPSLREEVERAHGSYGERTASYLLTMPLLSEYLEAGLAMFGLSCAPYEMNRL